MFGVLPVAEDRIRRTLNHLRHDTTDEFPVVAHVDPTEFTDSDMAELERELVFGRVPTYSSMSAEIFNRLHMRILALVGVPPRYRWVVTRGLEKLVFGLAAADADDLVQHRDQLPHNIDRATLPHVVDAVEAGESDSRALVEQAIRLFLEGVNATLLTRE